MTARALLILAAAFMLAGCAGLPAMPNLNLNLPQASQNKSGAIERSEKDGAVQLILHPVPVWDDKGASEPVSAKVDGRSVYVRKRRGGAFEQPWVKMGLLWNSSVEEVYIPVVVFGPPVDIRWLEFHREGGGRQKLDKARNVSFTPGVNFWERNRKMSSGVFSAPLEVLDDMVSSKVSRVAVNTNRGYLYVDLGALSGDSPSATRQNAKVLFSQFNEMRAASQTL